MSDIYIWMDGSDVMLFQGKSNDDSSRMGGCVCVYSLVCVCVCVCVLVRMALSYCRIAVKNTHLRE
jgi:hypothetical protein